MISKARRRTVGVAAAAAAAVLLTLVAAPEGATAAVRDGAQPHTVTGALIQSGADGTERTLACPPQESVMGGGFIVSPQPGAELDSTPTDVTTSRPNADASAWIVAANRHDKATGGTGVPANLTLYVVCTEGTNTPGG